MERRRCNIFHQLKRPLTIRYGVIFFHFGAVWCHFGIIFCRFGMVWCRFDITDVAFILFLLFFGSTPKEGFCPSICLSPLSSFRASGQASGASSQAMGASSQVSGAYSQVSGASNQGFGASSQASKTSSQASAASSPTLDSSAWSAESYQVMGYLDSLCFS